MIEKQNMPAERKAAAGDAGALDDIVDFAAKKMDVSSSSLRARRAARHNMASASHVVPEDGSSL